MNERDNRPVNLDLTTIHFPPPAIASILHRISGVILFLSLPFLLWLLEASLSASGFQTIQNTLRNPMVRFLVWGVLAALLYHLVAGIRHLLMDAHVAEGRISGRISAWSVFGISLILILLMGIWLWC